MKILHHNDLDGRLSAAYILNYFGDKPIDFFEMTYTIPVPFDQIKPDEEVWIVDFSIKPKEMVQLMDITTNIVWIDHHKTSLDQYKNFNFRLKGLRHIGLAGCVLTYMYLNDLSTDQLSKVPNFIKFIGDYDCWTFDFKESRPFYYGMLAEDSDPKATIWKRLLFKEDVTYDVIKQGETVLKFRDSWSKDYCKSFGFEAMLDDKKCFALPLLQCGSEYFGGREKDYDMLIAFGWLGDQWTVSLYSTKIDVSQIAKKLGGGGHKGAAGFSCKKLPFNKI